MIPKIIHQIWVGYNPVPAKLIQTWKDMNPTWEHRLWTNHAGWECQNRIDECKEWNGKADIMRWEILYHHGGVYIDADSICVKPLDDSFTEREVFSCWENEIIRAGLIATGYVGSEKGHPLMRKCIDRIKSRPVDGAAWRLLGPSMFTEECGKDPALFVYPARTFIPMHYTKCPAPGDWPVYADQRWGTTLGYDRLY